MRVLWLLWIGGGFCSRIGGNRVYEQWVEFGGDRRVGGDVEGVTQVTQAFSEAGTSSGV